MTGELIPYYLSRWTCQIHGKFTARRKEKKAIAGPVSCPECIVEFDGEIKGFTSQPVPHVSKPRLPQKIKVEPRASDKAPLRKRGRGSW